MNRLVIRKSVYNEIMALLMRKAWVEGEHPRDGAGRFALAPDTGLNPSGGNSSTKTEDAQRKADIKMLSTIIETGKSTIIKNSDIGAISLDAGEAKKASYGINHIIHERYLNEGKTKDEITSLLMLLVDTLRKGKISRDVKVHNKSGKDIGRYDIEKDGIVAVVSKQRYGKDENFVVTGFDDVNKKEAADAIQTGIARYGYTPEFSYFRKQVGAVVSSLTSVSSDSLKKSIARLKFQIARWELEQALRRLGNETNQ